MALVPLAPGAAFPHITSTYTDVWVEFWNVVLAQWFADNMSGGSGSAWPAAFTMNGRILETEDDGLSPTLTDTPTLGIKLISGSKFVVDGVFYTLEDDIIISSISPNFTGWIVPTAAYDSQFETVSWQHDEYSTRPEKGAGVACKVVTNALQVTSITVDETEVDVIPLLPVLLDRLRAGGGGGGGGSEYLTGIKYSIADPRPATVVIEEKLAMLRAEMADLIESGGVKESLPVTDQLENMILGLCRGLRDTYPQAMRFLTIGTVRPGVWGTESASDSEVNDLGGTITERTDQRDYSA